MRLIATLRFGSSAFEQPLGPAWEQYPGDWTPGVPVARAMRWPTPSTSIDVSSFRMDRAV